SASTPASSAASSVSSAETVAGRIKVNQLGFAPSAQKLAVVPASDATSFAVVDSASGTQILTGTLSASNRWPLADETVALADFSELQSAGSYRVQVAGLPDSDPFTVGAEPYNALNKASIKAFYFNRASTQLLPEHAGDWARPAGHPDTEVLIHASAASAERPVGTVLSSPKGWYDAGDYGKYIVNSGISTYTLLAALEQFPDYYANRDLNIPESGDAIPDLLDETLWNVDWMLTMQDPHDGGVYHKLTTKNFAGIIMPHEGTEPRYIVQKGTGATLNFAAVMAAASRVLADYQEAFPGKSAEMLAAAEAAWQWALANPNVRYQQPDDVHTGAYGDSNFADEFAWAAAELYITTGNDSYYQALDAPNTGNAVPAWPQSLGLAWMSLAYHKDALTEAADTDLIEQRVIDLADNILTAGNNSAYRVSMTSSDFVWGSNGGAMNRAMMLLQAYRLTDNDAYLNAAQDLLDYVLGRNPTDYSYVTGFGERPPMEIHHRQSAADDVHDPVPGFLAGGPHSGQQDDCDYPSNLPAKSYVDHWCSYSTNEVTINWNAPLVYVTGALEVYYAD
ncbi:MAG TPA: glycoside hydrolase family 9 protein, partial [Cellvibrionaceae bacterium]